MRCWFWGGAAVAFYSMHLSASSMTEITITMPIATHGDITGRNCLGYTAMIHLDTIWNLCHLLTGLGKDRRRHQ